MGRDGEQPSKKVLRFLPEFRDKILNREKTSTVRKGRVEKYEKGDVVEILIGEENIGEAVITSVKHLMFRELTPSDAKKDGFKSKSELKRTLKHIYGRMKGEDVITHIEFELLRKKKKQSSDKNACV